MKVNLSLLLIMLCATMALTLKVPSKPKCPPLPKIAGQCICPKIYAPVCGKSGRTFSNKCFADCQGEKIKHNGACYLQCHKKVTFKKRCVSKKFGAYGTRNWCCKTGRVCWGNDCVATKKHCFWSGKVVIVYKQKKCTWSRIPGRAIKRCCVWKKICTNNDCYDTKHFCKTARIERKTKSKICKKIALGSGTRKKCCQQFKLCVTERGVKRCSTKKGKCVWIGKVITRKTKTLCGLVKRGKGQRKKCCTRVYRCAGKDCVVISKKCKWKGCTIYKKRHFKCTRKKFGKTGTRKRCCMWTSRCSHKKCRITYKRCFWKGCARYVTKRYKCTWHRKGKKQVQKCCHFDKQCEDGKCKIFNKRCVWGKTKHTKYVFNCKNKKSGRYGTRRWCCKHIHKCVNKKCKITSKCKWVGKITTRRKHYRCSIKREHQKKYNNCCSWTRVCCEGKCNIVNKTCKRRGSITRWKYIEKCGQKHICKGTTQTQCCTWKQVCISGKGCRKHNKKCRLVGFPIKITKHKRCVMVPRGKGSRRLKCCKFHKTCKNGLCKVKRVGCYWKGPVCRTVKKVKCVRKQYHTHGVTRKWCCQTHSECKGKKCVVKDKHCDWSGLVRVIRKRKTIKWRKWKKHGKRVYICKWTQTCQGGSCKNSKKKCQWKGFAIFIYKRTSIKWKWKRKTIKQKWYCVWFSRCVNNKCKTTKKKNCKWVGSVIKITIHRQCRMVTVGKRATRKRCLIKTLVCKDNKCHVKTKKYVWVGKVITVKSKLVCKAKSRGSTGKRSTETYCCRYILKCHGNKCKNLFAPSCYWSATTTRVKKSDCKWVFVTPPKPTHWAKRRKCKYWTQSCHSKNGCTNINIKIKWVGKIIKQRIFRTCQVKFFGTNHKRKYCCSKVTICKGSKCHTRHQGKCKWEGESWRVKQSYELYRYKTLCKDQIVGKSGSDIRLRCCRDYQKCTKSHGSGFVCNVVKKGKCWWAGAARGDVHVYAHGEWKDLPLEGTVKYMHDETSAIGVYTQFTQFPAGATGTSTTAVAITSGTNVLLIEKTSDSTFQAKVNGVVKSEADFTFGTGNVKVNGAELDFTSNQDTITVELSQGIFELVVKVDTQEDATGLFVTGTHNPEGQCLTAEEATRLGFTQIVPCQLIAATERPDVTVAQTEVCCGVLSKDGAYSSCVQDFQVEPVPLAEHYASCHEFLKIFFISKIPLLHLKLKRD